MGMLRDVAGGRAWYLARRNLLGRDPAATLRNESGLVSGHHAHLEWRDGEWMVVDQRSRNGTWLRGSVLAPWTEVVVRRGDTLTLGGAAAWELVLEEDGPPGLFAVRVSDGAQVDGLGDVLGLEADGAVAIVHRDADGRWVTEIDGVAQPVHDGDVVVGGAWRVHLPDLSATTPHSEGALCDLSTARLLLHADQPYERFSLAVIDGGRTVELGIRASWFLLWLLAEAMLDDSGPVDERGWVDMQDLARDFGKRGPAVDQYISLARKYLAGVGVRGAQEVILARPNQRRLGVGPAQLELVHPTRGVRRG